ncbi:MAG: DUF2089 domain-containing protein [Thermoanaerobaculia bacterium]|nr:DUF2089 domain-containing protein [Thermoanaerobaculia bacterium]
MDISKARCNGCNQPMEIKRLECPQCGVSTEGEFEVPPLARLSSEDQVFVHAFVRHHGSIKKMEGIFGISYPTVKNRLRAITAELDKSFEVPSTNTRVLEALRDGEITIEEALEKIT